MLKFLTILIILGAAGSGVYYLFSMEKASEIKVSGKLQISKHPDYIIKNLQNPNAPYFAVVEGMVRNNSAKPIKNIFIKYIIGGQKTSATVFDLAPGQETKFNTRGINTEASDPEYNYEGICYDETSF